MVGRQGRERRSETANAHAQDVYKNPTLTGTLPGQGVAQRTARASAVASNTSSNPNLLAANDEATVESGDAGGTGNTGSPGGSAWKPEGNFVYYYHPDHLGSTGFVTDQDGRLYEHLQYFPFGETWVQQHSNSYRTPYLYTAKELDQETGLYYFGARYYDPRTSVSRPNRPNTDRVRPQAAFLTLIAVGATSFLR